MRVLAGDIGATNARLAVVEIHGAETRVLQEQQFRSRDFAGLAPVVQRFRAATRTAPDRACFGVAGPVIDGECRGTNLPWTINERELAGAIGILRTTLINDFAAVGHGIGLLGAADVETLQPGEPVQHGVIAVIGAGTGLGEGFLVWDGSRYRVQASEGGHVDFAPRDDLEWRLFQTLRGELAHVSYERVASGPGLVDIYRHLRATGLIPEASAVRAEAEREDPAAVIVRYALADADALCAKALDVFVSVLGAQAGNLALTVLALGGVYLAGGIAPRIVARLKAGPFLQSFRSKGRLSGLLTRMPVRVIMNPNVGLLGAAAVAAR
ncbi:MAG TPA: glucokinase [Gemmatimonadales bacterium]|nr:glucokinase [Gemmatimonadales bacterium]